MGKNKIYKVKIGKNKFHLGKSKVRMENGEEKGYILVGVLVFITVFSILSIALLSFLRNEIVMYQKMEASIKAEYLALGGVQAYQKLKSNMVLFPIDEDPGTKIVITLSEEPETAESTGVINEGNDKEISFTVAIKDGQIKSD